MPKKIKFTTFKEARFDPELSALWALSGDSESCKITLSNIVEQLKAGDELHQVQKEYLVNSLSSLLEKPKGNAFGLFQSKMVLADGEKHSGKDIKALVYTHMKKVIENDGLTIPKAAEHVQEKVMKSLGKSYEVETIASYYTKYKTAQGKN